MPKYQGSWVGWFGAGLLATTTLGGVGTTDPAFAQSLPATPRADRRVFDIAPQTLAAALAQFAKQSGSRVTPDAGIAGRVTSPGVRGRMTAAEALQRVLAGTGITYVTAAEGGYLLKRPVSAPVATEAANSSDAATELPAVRVEAQSISPYVDPQAPYKADRLSSTRFTEPVLNTPRSVTVVTREALDDKNSTTLKEVARSTAGVTLGSGEGGNAFGDRFFIRGFDARNDIFIDGLRDPGVSIRENFNAEQIEILRGPASSFAGRGTTGGAINIVTKEARDTNFYRVEGQGAFIEGAGRGTIDANQVVNDKVSVRLNAMGQGGGVPGRDYTTDNRFGAAAAVTVRPTEDITVKANYAHTELFGLPDFGVPYNPATHRPLTDGGVSRDTYYGITNRDFTHSTQDTGGLNAEWRVGDWLTLENRLRVSHSLLDYVGTIPENPSATGATARYSSNVRAFSGFVQLNAQSRYEPVDVFADQPQATFRFNTGPIRHTAVIGGEFSREDISIDSYKGLTSEITTGPVAFASSGAPIVNAFDPPHTLANLGGRSLTGNPLRYNVDTNAGYLIDTANYSDLVIANGGVRYDDYNITSSNNTSSRHATSGITSYNGGLVIKPLPSVSLYGAYATAADPVGDELDALSSTYGGFSPTQPTTQIFGPIQSTAYEAGAKWELFDRHLLATGAAFQTNVANARESAPANLKGYTSGQIVAGAAYRVRGLDFELAGRITDRWSLLAGLVLMNTDVTKSIVPTNIGLRLANIANQSFNLLTKYNVTHWLELGGQGVYASRIQGGSLLVANGGVAYPNPPNPTILPSHWRFDVFAETKITPQILTKLYVQNIFNRTYYDALYQSAQPFVQVAPGRSVTLIAAAKF